MKYTVDITINLPRQKVVDLFFNHDNMHKWMPGLKSFKHKSGTPYEIGAVTELTFEVNGKTFVMDETITVKELPNKFGATYTHEKAWSETVLEFKDEGDKTKVLNTSEFKLSGFMKIVGFLFPFIFKQESVKNLKAFKKFAEDNIK